MQKRKRVRLAICMFLILVLTGCSTTGPSAPDLSMVNPISKETLDPVERSLLILRHGSSSALFGKAKEDAISTLGVIGDPRGVSILLEYLRHESNEHLRMEMINALGWLGDKRAVPDLLERLKSGTGQFERAAAAHALGEIGDTTAISAIEAAIEQHPSIAREGIEALKKLGKTEVSEIDDDTMLREIEALMEQFPDVKKIRDKALEALKKNE